MLLHVVCDGVGVQEGGQQVDGVGGRVDEGRTGVGRHEIAVDDENPQREQGPLDGMDLADVLLKKRHNERRRGRGDARSAKRLCR